MGPCASQPVSQEPTDHRNEPHPPPTGLGAPPASTAPGLVAWSTAKVGPWTARGVWRSSRRPGEWKPAEGSAQKPLSQPGDVHPSFKASTAREQGQRNGGRVLASKKAAPLQPATSSRPLKSLPFKGSKGPLHLPLESHLCQEAGQEQSTPWGEGGARAGLPYAFFVLTHASRGPQPSSRGWPWRHVERLPPTLGCVPRSHGTQLYAETQCPRTYGAPTSVH